jgi:hypothetical protein
MFDFITHDDWRWRLMDEVYRRQAEINKGKPVDFDRFRSAVAEAWAGVIEGIELRFFQGIQWALSPDPPTDIDLWHDWERNNFDQRGKSVLFYDPDFERRFFELLVEYGQVQTIEKARIYCGLADRYAKRGEWMLLHMADMWLDLPTLAEQEIIDFYQRRIGEGQLSLLAALGWE